METSSNKKIHFEHNGADAVLSSAYVESLTNDCFAPDVILKIGPEKTEFSCHRLVLAAFSEFLADILATATPGTIPVILLPDLQGSVMEFVITFMYYGEVHIPTMHYADFVDACQLLELKGPTDDVKLVTENDCDDDAEEEDEDDDVLFINCNEEPLPETRQTIGNDSFLKLGEAFTINDASFLQTNPHQMTTYKNMYNKNRVHKLYVTKARFTPELKRTAKQRLIKTITRAYTSLGIPMTERIHRMIAESRVVVENGILVRGAHICGVCSVHDAKEAHLRYKIYHTGKGHITFMTDSFKMHLKKKHKLML